MSVFSHYTSDFPNERISNWDNTFKKAKTTWDPHFGEIEILPTPGAKGEIMCKTKTLDNFEDLKSNISFLNSRAAIKHPNIANLIDFSYKSVNDWCSRYYI